MKTENATSRQSSGARLKTAPPEPPIKTVPAHESDAEFLERQAAEGKAAFHRAIADFRRAMASSVDATAVTREHPWASVGIAAASGFATAIAMVPTREEAAMRKLAAYQRLLHEPAAERSGDKSAHGADPEKPRSTLTSILREAFLIAKPAITAALTAGISAKLNQNHPAAEESSDARDGRPPEQPAQEG